MAHPVLDLLNSVVLELKGTAENWRLPEDHSFRQEIAKIEELRERYAREGVDAGSAQTLMDLVDEIRESANDPQNPDLVKDIVLATGSIRNFVLTRSPSLSGDRLRF